MLSGVLLRRGREPGARAGVRGRARHGRHLPGRRSARPARLRPQPGPDPARGTRRAGAGGRTRARGAGRDAASSHELRATPRARGAPQERLLAADLLRRLGATDAVDDLRRLGGDADAEVRRVALAAVAALDGRRGIDVLMAALEDPEGRVRATAVTALGELGRAGDVLAAAERDAPGGVDPGREPAVRAELAVLAMRSGRTVLAAASSTPMLGSGSVAERGRPGRRASARTRDGCRGGRWILDDDSPRIRAAALRAGATLASRSAVSSRSWPPSTTRLARSASRAATLVRDRDRRRSRSSSSAFAHGTDRLAKPPFDALEGHTETVRDEPPRLDGRPGPPSRRSCADWGAALAGVDASPSAAYLGYIVGRRSRSHRGEAPPVPGRPRRTGGERPHPPLPACSRSGRPGPGRRGHRGPRGPSAGAWRRPAPGARRPRRRTGGGRRDRLGDGAQPRPGRLGARPGAAYTVRAPRGRRSGRGGAGRSDPSPIVRHGRQTSRKEAARCPTSCSS